MLARLGTALGDLEPVAPQEAFLSRLEDLLVARAKHVDVRTMLRQVAGEVDGDGETITRTTIADLDDQIARLETAIKAVIASDPEQAERYRILTSIPGVGPVTAAALLCWMSELGSLGRRQAAALIGVGRRSPTTAASIVAPDTSAAGAEGRAISCSWPPPRRHTTTRISQSCSNASRPPARPTRSRSSL